ncbi:uncharacterized protein LOC117784803 [Drosophila innubila]|uniref:uncharacterized protein LOC117784803 n=1 Tax=Drosophila innubila TaxID=198719 RepID=UPI00148C8022|nr:uncharacterized protein LOC117784803 [Drosophila innubila]
MRFTISFLLIVICVISVSEGSAISVARVVREAEPGFKWTLCGHFHVLFVKDPRATTSVALSVKSGTGPGCVMSNEAERLPNLPHSCPIYKLYLARILNNYLPKTHGN